MVFKRKITPTTTGFIKIELRPPCIALIFMVAAVIARNPYPMVIWLFYTPALQHTTQALLPREASNNSQLNGAGVSLVQPLSEG